MNYQHKYLKYKQKYLFQKGGSTMIITLVKPISKLLKENMVSHVIQHWKEFAEYAGVVNNLSANMSAEGGFELPMTAEWLSKLSSHPLINYHSTRQMRFVESGDNIIGLRLKDGIPYWTDKEIAYLTDILLGYVNKLSEPSKDKPVLEAPTTTNFYYYFDYGIPVVYKTDFTIRVINNASRTNTLKNINQSFSSEGGFQMPLTIEWKIMLSSMPRLEYHTARELLFIVDNNFIIGLKLKDGIPYWSRDEIAELLEICNKEIISMNLPRIPFKPPNSINDSYYITSDNKLIAVQNLWNQQQSISEFDDVTFDKFKSRKIKLNKTVPLELKERFLRKVAKKAKKTKRLESIKINKSGNGGFYLPMTSKWANFANLKTLTRDIELIIKEDKITGLRFTDDTPLWTNKEVDKLIDIINKVIKKLK